MKIFQLENFITKVWLHRNFQIYGRDISASTTTTGTSKKLSTLSVYHIAGNFRGIQFHGWSIFTIFAGLIFVDARTHAHYVHVPYNWAYFAGLILWLGSNPRKQRKLDPSKTSHYTVVTILVLQAGHYDTCSTHVHAHAHACGEPNFPLLPTTIIGFDTKVISTAFFFVQLHCICIPTCQILLSAILGEKSRVIPSPPPKNTFYPTHKCKG